MAKSAKKTLLMAKLQTAAGTEAVPTGATDSILLRNLTATPLSTETVERALLRPYMGNSGQIVTSVYTQIEGEVELAGSGTPGKVPAWGGLLRGCGFAEVVEDTEVTYTPVSDDFEMLTLHYYLDGLFHKITDARGTVSFDISAKGIPFMRFRFMGVYHPITDKAAPTDVDFSAFQTPLGVNKKNTPHWSLGGYSGCLQSLNLDLANSLVWRSLISCEGAEITDRQPTGQISLELPKIADLNWPEMVRNAVLQPLSITHGTQPGNIVTLSAPGAQLSEPSYSEADNVAMLGMNMSMQPGQGNDEIKIVVS